MKASTDIFDNRLKDFCLVGDGTHASIRRQDDGILYLTSKNFKSTGLDLSKVDFISNADYEKHFEKSRSALVKPSPGDVVFGIIGSIGTPYIVRPKDHFGISSSVAILRPNDELDSTYLFHYMTSRPFQLAVEAIKSGVAQGFLSLEMIRNLPLIKFGLPTQRKIAAILTAYDDLIETNKRRIALLEKMAEELYREWFVRMRFPGHQNTKFVKGVPEGWEISRVDSLGKIVTGKTPSTSVPRYYNGQYPFIKTPDMHGNMFISETSESLSEEGGRSQPSQTIPENSLCVSCIGTGGIVSITTTTSHTNQQINSVCLKREEDLEWSYFVLRGLKETIWLFGSTGTTMTNLSKGKFSGLKFFSPRTELRDEFHTLANPLFSEIRVLASANRTLTQTRDLLLPRLISGKLSVEDLDVQFPPSMREEATQPEPVHA